MHTVGVFAAIFDEHNRILCVKRAYGDGAWTQPGGRVELGEAPDDALVREVREETGFVIRIGHLIGVYATPWKNDIVLYFQAERLERRSWQANQEIADIEFFGQQALPEPLSPRARVRIDDAFKKRTGVMHIFRSGDSSSL